LQPDGTRLPPWVKVKLPTGEKYQKIHDMMRSKLLHTVCEEARCPNIAECWGNEGTATFLILGDVCTRHCGFCSIKVGKPRIVNPLEPKMVAESVKQMGIDYAVITSVNRDDLPDGGASIFVECIQEIRALVPDCKVELLIPDFDGNFDALKMVIEAKPDVLGHNIETTRQLHRRVRPYGTYDRALEVLRRIKEFDATMPTKSNIILGFGETEEDVIQIMKDLRNVNCDLLTITQYLRPTKINLRVVKYYHPDEFKRFKEVGLSLGFKHVEAGPLVRTSYHAKEQWQAAKIN